MAREYRSLFEGFGLALILVLVTSAKPGAGLVHMLPLVPSSLFIAGRMLQSVLVSGKALDLDGSASLGRAVVVAVVVTALTAGSINEYRAVKLLDWQQEQTPDLVADLKVIMERYPDLTLSMACGGENASFRHTWMRPLLVFANHPLLLDPIAVMDCRLAGRDLPPETYRAIAEGDVSVWLVPRDRKPFAKLNWYAPHGPVFPKRFRSLFRDSYTIRDHSRYFDLWFYNGLPPGAAKSPPVVRRASSG